MAIEGLATYSNTSFYYAHEQKSAKSEMNSAFSFGLMARENSEQVETTGNKRASFASYSRFMSTSIRKEELFVSQAEEVSDEAEQPMEEELIPLGIGFANAGMYGYGMSATQVISPGTDDVIVRVKIEGETIDVNLSKFDARNATPVEMFAYCQYMDSIGQGVNNKWGSWNAMKIIAASGNADAMDYGSLDDIKNKKLDWADMLAASKTSMEHAKTGATVSVADLLKMLEEANSISADDLKSDDWRDMSDEEWEKMLEEFDQYIDKFKKEIEEMKKLQEEAAKKAAMAAPSDMKTTAAAEAALATASGLGMGNVDAESGEGERPADLDEPHEKNWTKKLDTDNQTVLRTAKEAQRMANMAEKKIKEIASGHAEYSSYEYYSFMRQRHKKDEEEMNDVKEA